MPAHTSPPERGPTRDATWRATAPAPTSTPVVSVVVASNRDEELLRACVQSLAPQCARAGAELIVARAGTPDEVADVAARMPEARFVQTAHRDIPRLRGAGMAAARGEVVAVTEDHCVASDGWLDALVAGMSESADVVGGGMDNARVARAVDWGAYFSEYGFFAPMRETSRGGPPLLTGANVAYRRPVVADVTAWAQAGEWENTAHGRLAERGSRMAFAPKAAIYQNKSYGFASFCVDRYEHGRDYARTRLTESPSANRWTLAAASPLLPALLTYRVGRAASRGRVGTFVRALPATFAFLTAWSVGELVGYLRGPVPR